MSSGLRMFLIDIIKISKPVAMMTKAMMTVVIRSMRVR